MKKYWKLLLAVAVGMVGLAACEDVPAPYNIPTDPVGPVGPTADYIFNQAFGSNLGDFQSQSESGTLAWSADSRYGAIITGYQDFDGSGQKTNKPGTTYLISPEIELNDCDSAYVVIEQAINYAKSTLDADHKLLIRLAGTEAWTELPMSMDGLGNSFSYITQNVQIPQNYIGQKIQLALKHIAHNDYSSTWEVKSIKVAKGQAPAAGGTPIEGLVGTGTKDDPYDVASTIKLIAAGPPSTKIYTKGVVCEVDASSFDSQFGSLIYYISDDGTQANKLEVYRGYGLGGAHFSAADALKPGDKVIVYGQVVYYNNKTMEFTSGSQLYMLNDETSGDEGGGGGEAKGSGSKEDPYNVAAAIAGSGNAWVSGYIVGWVEGQVLSSGAHFNGSSSVASNILIADSPDETNVANCMPVQLPGGSDVRTALNLVDNPGNYKKQVKLYGSLEKYFGAPGLKSVSQYEIDGSTPTPTPEPGEPKGSGTLADPYNGAAAAQIASALASNAQSDQAFYIKGKVVSVKEQFGTQYGNVTCFISDDGTTTGQFQVFRAFYLGNRKWVTGDKQIAVGDDIVVYAKLTNYQGNTPETVAGKEGQDHGYLYSLNGQTDGGDQPGPGPDPQPGVKTLADFTNGDFEAWTNGQPNGWKSASSASNATLSQSTVAHGGTYSVKVGGATSANKRIAYEELELEAGTYNCSFWAKAATDSPASLCPGYAAIGDGNPTYNYDKGEDGKNKYVNDIAQEWQQVKYSFTLEAKTTVCLIIMNSKSTGTDMLIDDFTITKN